MQAVKEKAEDIRGWDKLSFYSHRFSLNFACLANFACICDFPRTNVRFFGPLPVNGEGIGVGFPRGNSPPSPSACGEGSKSRLNTLLYPAESSLDHR